MTTVMSDGQRRGVWDLARDCAQAGVRNKGSDSIAKSLYQGGARPTANAACERTGINPFTWRQYEIPPQATAGPPSPGGGLVPGQSSGSDGTRGSDSGYVRNGDGRLSAAAERAIRQANSRR